MHVCSGCCRSPAVFVNRRYAGVQDSTFWEVSIRHDHGTRLNAKDDPEHDGDSCTHMLLSAMNACSACITHPDLLGHTMEGSSIPCPLHMLDTDCKIACATCKSTPTVIKSSMQAAT